MKNNSFVHLKTSLFTIKTAQHVGFWWPMVLNIHKWDQAWNFNTWKGFPKKKIQGRCSPWVVMAKVDQVEVDAWLGTVRSRGGWFIHIYTYIYIFNTCWTCKMNCHHDAVCWKNAFLHWHTFCVSNMWKFLGCILLGSISSPYNMGGLSHPIYNIGQWNRGVHWIWSSYTDFAHQRGLSNPKDSFSDTPPK